MGNGSTTEFNFNFPFYENTNIVVTKNATTLTSGYSVIGTSAGSDANIPYTGGKVIFDAAPIATDSITISRSLPLTRIVDYQPTAKINPTVLNQDMNYMIEVLKDFSDELGDFDTLYTELTDTESTTILVQKMNTVSQQIIDLGDISTLRQSVTANTENIGMLDTRTTGIIDYVIESQNPTAENNYTWYRKYKSGWIEQGGRVTSSTTWNGAALLVCSFTSTNYNIQATMSRNSFGNGTNALNYFVTAEPVTTGAFCWATISHDGTQEFRAFQWCACGY